MERSVVVTGTSTGIGRVTAQTLVERGFRVFASVRRPEDADALRAEGRDALVPLLFDVTDRGAIERAAEEVAAAVGAGGLAGLVNNAGIGVGGPVEFVDDDELRRQFEVNVFGTAAVTRAFLPLLHAARGRVVNVSSALGAASMPLVGAYCASKSALEALSDALRIELRRAGVRVVVIQPGVIATPMHEKGRVVGREALDALPPAGRERYAAAFRAREDASEGFERRATPPETVARAVHRALVARRPRARYAVGLDAKGLVVLARFLPTPLLDAILGRMVRL